MRVGRPCRDESGNRYTVLDIVGGLTVPKPPKKFMAQDKQQPCEWVTTDAPSALGFTLQFPASELEVL